MDHASIKKVLIVDTVVFIAVLCAAVAGVGLTDFKGLASESYWKWLFIITALVTTIWGLWRDRQLGMIEERNLLYHQVVIWGSGLIAMGVIYLLLSTGRLNYETTGLLILLLLALLTFIDGMIVSWKLYLVGLTQLAILLTTTYIESYLWLILLFSAIIILLVILYVVFKIKKLKHPH